MKIEMSDAISVNEDEIAAFEKTLGARLPEKFRSFIARNNGAKLAANFYDENCDCKRFIPLTNIIDERNYVYEVADNLIPIAESVGSCYILLNLDDESIYHWDYDFPQEQKKLGTDIHDFLSQLKPEDSLEVQVHPESKVTYSDPQFREEQRRMGNLRTDNES